MFAMITVLAGGLRRWTFNSVLPVSNALMKYSTNIVNSVKLPINQVNKDDYIRGYDKIHQINELPESIKETFKLKFANKMEWNKIMRADMIRQLQERDGDTGSTHVQIGVMTSRINYLQDHMRKNRKDKSCLRRLLHLVHKRRKLLVYLRKTNFTLYHTLLQQLNLKPIKDSKYGYIKKQ